jgi:hypothetical protein
MYTQENIFKTTQFPDLDTYNIQYKAGQPVLVFQGTSYNYQACIEQAKCTQLKASSTASQNQEKQFWIGASIAIKATYKRATI